MAEIKTDGGVDILDVKDNRGGARQGAGRKKGTKNNVTIGSTILEYTTPTELKYMVERAKKHAKTDKKVLLFLLEHIFGKANTTKATPPKKEDANNMANFLDKLEKDERRGRPKTVKQGVEIEPPLPDNEQEAEEDSLQVESGSAEFSGESPLEEHNPQEPTTGIHNA